MEPTVYSQTMNTCSANTLALFLVMSNANNKHAMLELNAILILAVLSGSLYCLTNKVGLFAETH